MRPGPGIVQPGAPRRCRRHATLHENGCAPQKTADDKGNLTPWDQRRNQSPHPSFCRWFPALMWPSVNHPPYRWQVPTEDQTVKPHATSGTGSCTTHRDTITLASSKSPFTISRTISSKGVRGSQPSTLLAFAGSPRSRSTSVGRK